MKKRKFIKELVSCKYYPDGVDVKHCKDCTFFNGMDETSIDCLRPEIPSLNCHVIGFTMGNYLYKLRRYDENIDGSLKEAYEYCEKCCFNKTLKNGNEVCLLRCGTEDANFMCCEGEIWEKSKIE